MAPVAPSEPPAAMPVAWRSARTASGHRISRSDWGATGRIRAGRAPCVSRMRCKRLPHPVGVVAGGADRRLPHALAAPSRRHTARTAMTGVSDTMRATVFHGGEGEPGNARDDGRSCDQENGHVPTAAADPPRPMRQHHERVRRSQKDRQPRKPEDAVAEGVPDDLEPKPANRARPARVTSATSLSDQGGSCPLRAAQGHRGAGLRPDQGAWRLPSLPSPGQVEGERRVAAGVRGPQPGQAVPQWPGGPGHPGLGRIDGLQNEPAGPRMGLTRVPLLLSTPLIGLAPDHRSSRCSLRLCWRAISDASS